MNQMMKFWRTLFPTPTRPGEGGRLPPVPLGWRAGGAPAASDHRPEPPEITTRAVVATRPQQAVAAPVTPAAPAPPAPARIAVPVTAGVPSVTRAPAISRATPADEEMMRRALDLARQALAVGEVPVGAVVYETATGRVLGEGYNRREVDKDPTAHAELIAIREAAAALGDWRLNGCTLVVTLEPCAMCSGLIVNARVGRLVYGTRDPKAGAAESLYHLTNDARLNHRVEPISEVMAGESSRLLSEFFKRLRARR